MDDVEVTGPGGEIRSMHPLLELGLRRVFRIEIGS